MSDQPINSAPDAPQRREPVALEAIETAKKQLEKSIVCLLQVSRNYVDEFGRRTELAEHEVTMAIDHLIQVVQAHAALRDEP